MSGGPTHNIWSQPTKQAFVKTQKEGGGGGGGKRRGREGGRWRNGREERKVGIRKREWKRGEVLKRLKGAAEEVRKPCCQNEHPKICFIAAVHIMYLFSNKLFMGS